MLMGMFSLRQVVLDNTAQTHDACSKASTLDFKVSKNHASQALGPSPAFPSVNVRPCNFCLFLVERHFLIIAVFPFEKLIGCQPAELVQLLLELTQCR